MTTAQGRTLPPGLHDAEIDALLAAAAALLATDVVFVGVFHAETFTFARVIGELTGISEGDETAAETTLCYRMLTGAPSISTDLIHDRRYNDAPVVTQLGLGSYIGVPIHGPDGTLVGTLCGLDRGRAGVGAGALAVLERLADAIGSHVGASRLRGHVVRRTPAGWVVGERADREESLLTALTLADLLAEDTAVPARPSRGGAPTTEVERLRTAVEQLEHALAARVEVEQAIGVLAERLGIAPRSAFERMRSVARRHGRRVHELARDVVRSATDPACPLPLELARPHRR